MGFDQQGNVVLRVSRGSNGRWDVCENDFEDPLASFDGKEEACDYAEKMKMGKEGATIVVMDEDMPGSASQGQGASPPLQ